MGTSPVDFAQIVDSDLARSGQFSPVSRRDMLSLPTSKEDIFYRDWRAIATRYLVIGRVSKGTQLRVDFALHDVERGIELFSGQVVGSESEARMVAHGVADAIYEKLTGIPGAFATRLIYVSESTICAKSTGDVPKPSQAKGAIAIEVGLSMPRVT